MITKNDNRKFNIKLIIISFLIMTYMFVVRDEIKILQLGILVLFLLLPIFLKRSDIIIYLSLLLPIINLLNVERNSMTIVPIIVIIYIVKSIKSNSKISPSFIVLFLFLFVSNIISSVHYFNNYTNILSTFIYLLFLYFLFQEEKNEEIYIKSSISFIISTLLIIVYLVVDSNFDLNVFLISNRSQRLEGISSVWNFALSLLISSSFLVVLINKEKISKFLGLVLYIIFIYFAILTVTQSTLIGFAILSIILFYNMIKNTKNKLLYLLFMPIVLLVFYFFVFKNIMDFRGGFDDSGRINLWKIYYEIFTKDLRMFIFGVGSSNILSLANEKQLYLTAHNVIIEILVEHGIFGSILFIFLLIAQPISKKRKTGINILPFLILLTFLMTQSGLNTLMFYLLFGISFLNKKDLDVSLINY